MRYQSVISPVTGILAVLGSGWFEYPRS